MEVKIDLIRKAAFWTLPIVDVIRNLRNQYYYKTIKLFG